MSVDVSILIGIAGCLVGVVGRMAGRDKHTVRNKRSAKVESNSAQAHHRIDRLNEIVGHKD